MDTGISVIKQTANKKIVIAKTFYWLFFRETEKRNM